MRSLKELSDKPREYAIRNIRVGTFEANAPDPYNEELAELFDKKRKQRRKCIPDKYECTAPVTHHIHLQDTTMNELWRDYEYGAVLVTTPEKPQPKRGGSNAGSEESAR